MLRRCEHVPVSIRIDVSKGSDDSPPKSESHVINVAYALLHARGRARELFVSVAEPEEAQHILACLDSGTSARLEVFELSCACSSLRIAPSQLGGSMPLRRLALHSAVFQDASGPLLRHHCSSLAHLRLSAIRGISLNDILGALEVAQETLLTLHLHDVRFAPRESTYEAIRNIDLPRLRVVSLRELDPPFSAFTPDALLHYITYASTASLTVWLGHQNVESISGALYAHLLQRRVDVGSVLLCQSISESVGVRRMGLRLRCWLSRSAPDYFNLEEHPSPVVDLDVRLTSRSTSSAVICTLSALAAAIDVTNVRNVAIGPIHEDVPWAHMLGLFHSLNELTLYGPEAVVKLWDAYTSKTSSGTRHDLVSELAQLTVINVVGIVLTPPRIGHSPSTTNPSVTQTSPSHADCQHDALSQILAALPRPLDQLRICYCDARACDINLLKFLVNKRNVIWDGSLKGRESMPWVLAREKETQSWAE